MVPVDSIWGTYEVRTNTRTFQIPITFFLLLPGSFIYFIHLFFFMATCCRKKKETSPTSKAAKTFPHRKFRHSYVKGTLLYDCVFPGGARYDADRGFVDVPKKFE
jgi:hypothetical protein